MKMLVLWCVLLTFLSAETLKISFSRSNPEPYVFIDKRELSAGVLKEIVDAIVKESGLGVSYVLVSKRNQDEGIKQGVIDGRCLINPSEVDNPEDYQWSNALYEEEDVLIVRKEDAVKLNNITALFGHKVGTIRSHSYPELKPYFQNNSIERVENKKLSNNMNQLKFGILDAVIDTKLSVSHCILKKNMEDKFIVSHHAIDHQELYCAFRKDMSIPMEKINASLSLLKEKGVIDAILKKYRAAL
jgi:polar amino acid transport system substrate-binding protein